MKKAGTKFWLLSAILIIFAAVSTAYVLFGFKWPVGTNVGYYINANTPQVNDEDDAVKKAANSWSQINPAGLRLSYKGSTSVTTYSYNGLNTVCWRDEGSSGTLATSWMWYDSGSNTTLETDMVFNDWYNWSTSGSDYDIQTVALHEFGHWVGLDHTSTGIMRVNYSGIQRSIDSDARAGFETMYGGGEQSPSIKLNRSSLSFTGEQEKIFRVRNSGGDTLLYQITDNKQWISVSPESGSSTGEWDDIVVVVETSGLSIGNYSGTIRVTSDNAVNSPQNLRVYLTVSEDEPPSVSIISPQNGDVVSGKITIDVDAIDDNGIKKVEFYVDNKLKKTDNHSPFRWNWDTTPYSSGHHTIKAKAYDTINQTAEDSVRVQVDQLPEISITSPSSGSNVFGNVALKASVSDDVGIKKVKFYINGVLEKIDSKSPYKYNWDTSSIFNGSYTIKAIVYDSINQTGEDEIDVILIPHAPLNFSGTKHNNSSTLLEQYINVLTWQANEKNKNIEKYRMYQSDGGDWILLAELNGDTFEYWHVNVEKDEKYIYVLKAVDHKNREGQSAFLEVQ